MKHYLVTAALVLGSLALCGLDLWEAGLALAGAAAAIELLYCCGLWPNARS